MSAANDRDRLDLLRQSLNGAQNSLRRDECGDFRITSQRGAIYRDGTGWLIIVDARSSEKHWTWTKKRLSFCRVTQDGDDEGCLHLATLPDAEQAATIRDIIGLRQTRPAPENAFGGRTFA